MHDRGTLFLVIGPSGVGKDSVLDGARAYFEQNKHIIFPKRHITRPANAGGETHIELSESAFAQTAQNGGFMLEWQAHGLSYGIAESVNEHLLNGCHVVANVSRTIIEEARRNLQPVRILAISAAPEIIRNRLMSRGRETAIEIAARVKRASMPITKGSDVFVVDNSDSLDAAIATFCTYIERQTSPSLASL